MNVKFYKLGAMQAWSASYEGIFVHLTNQSTVSDVTYKPGLYFGGYSGWEYLTNDAAAITAAINALDVTDVEIASISALSNASGVEVTLHDIKQTDGLIAQGSDNSDTKTFTVGDGALKLSGYGETSNSSIPTVEAADVFSANDTADSTIALSNAFVLDTTNKTIGLRTQTAVSATNNIATMSDIASLTGAMHYKGGVTAYPTPTADTKAGDTYVVTQTFTVGSVTYEVGDMLVANADGASATYTVVQSNMTIGTGAGQVATNDGALTADKIVLATANGIATSGYGVTDLASQATTVAAAPSTSLVTGETGVTITDTLTVGDTAQTGQVVTLKSGNDAIAVSNSGNTITLAHVIQSVASAQVNNAAVKITTDKYGHVTATSALVAGDISITDSDNHFTTDTVQGAINELYTRSGQHSTVGSTNNTIAVTSTTTDNVTNYNVDLVWQETLA